MSDSEMKEVPDSGWDSDADDAEAGRDPEELEASSSEGEEARQSSNGRSEGRRRRRDRSGDESAADDERTRQALEFVTRVVQQMGMDCRVRLRRPREENSEGEINLEISGRDAGRIIGKKGQVLQALQFL